MFFNLVCALIDIMLPLFQRYAVDEFIEAGTVEHIWRFAAVYGVVILIQSLSVIVFTRGSTRIELNLLRDMRFACFKHLQTLSFSYYNVTPVGYILARVMSDTGRISGLIAWNLVDILWALTYVIGVLIAMSFLNFQIGALGNSDCSVYCVPDRIFSETDSALEQKNTKTEFENYQRL